MARVKGPYSAAFPVNFTSGGDTTRDAFKKHMDEIARIYGILTDFDKDVANTESISGQLTNHINSTNPHPYWTLKPSWANITNKPTNLLTTDSTIAASKVVGELTNATIASGKITGLEAFVNGKIPASSGDGITDKSLSNSGYVKFKNGLIVQWGTSDLNKSEKKFTYTFPSQCLIVIGSTYYPSSISATPSRDLQYDSFTIYAWNKEKFTYVAYASGVENAKCVYLAVGY